MSTIKETERISMAELAHLIVFGPPPAKRQPKEIPSSGSSAVYGIPENLLDEDDEDGQEITITVRERKSWSKKGKGQSPNIWYPHLSRESPEIKKYSDDPRTANRWAVVRDGNFFNPRSVNREIDLRFDFGLMGSLKDCRAALCLTLLVLDPPITHFAVCPPDGEMVTFPVDPAQDTGEIPENRKPELETADAVGGGVQ